MCLTIASPNSKHFRRVTPSNSRSESEGSGLAVMVLSGRWRGVAAAGRPFWGLGDGGWVWLFPGALPRAVAGGRLWRRGAWWEGWCAVAPPGLEGCEGAYPGLEEAIASTLLFCLLLWRRGG